MSASPTTPPTDQDQEVKNHRLVLKQIRERCQGFENWVSCEALLYMQDGDKIVEHFCLWVFPNANDRYLVSTNLEDGIDEEQVGPHARDTWVMLQGGMVLQVRIHFKSDQIRNLEVPGRPAFVPHAWPAAQKGSSPNHSRGPTRR